MGDSTKPINRYSDADLAEFRAAIEQKIEKTERQLEDLKENIAESRENAQDDHADYGDEGSQMANIEYLNNMAIRQEKYLSELNQALARVINKTYGICEVTGELIDKRRLLAVPITTKSLAAKLEREKAKAEGRQATPPADNEDDEPKKPRKAPPVTEKKVFSRVVKKTAADGSPVVAAPKPANDDDDDFDDDDDNENTIDLDLGDEEE